MIDDQFGRLTALAMFESDLSRWVSKHDEWFGPLKYKLDKGLVFRLRKEAAGTGWKPGMMRREGAKWVWKEKSIEELREYDIHLSRVSWFTSSAVLTVWRIYHRLLVDVSVIRIEVTHRRLSGLGTRWGRDASSDDRFGMCKNKFYLEYKSQII